MKDYLQFCRNESTMIMQENGYMIFYLFLRWTDHFIQELKELGDFSQFNKHIIILDGHKSHVTLEVIKKPMNMV